MLSHNHEGISRGVMSSKFDPSHHHHHVAVDHTFNCLCTMSFGFGVGDFLAVAEASKKIWNQFEKSPSYIKDARDE
jgi:hypothetical protein